MTRDQHTPQDAAAAATAHAATAFASALSTLGEQMTQAFEDAGVRVVASLAFGQVFNGRDDLAEAALLPLSEDQRYAIHAVCGQLGALAYSMTAEGAEARAAAEAAGVDRAGMNIARAGLIFRLAHSLHHDDLRAELAQLGPAEVYSLLATSRMLGAELAAYLPRPADESTAAAPEVDEYDGHLFEPVDPGAPESGVCLITGCFLRWGAHEPQRTHTGEKAAP